MSVLLALMTPVFLAPGIKPRCTRYVSDPPTFEKSATWTPIGFAKFDDVVWQVKIYSFVNPENNHGNYHLIFFRNRKFIGSYDMGTNIGCKMRGRAVFCWDDEGNHDLLPINRKGPPCKVIFGGYQTYFYRL